MFNINPLLPELKNEVFQRLKPYTLKNLSKTSQFFQQFCLDDSLWKNQVTNEFPYCLAKGSYFEKYSICKYNSLKHIEDPLIRKLFLLVEANHFEEIKEVLSKCKTPLKELLVLRIERKTLALLINEQNDQPLRDFFFEEIKKQEGDGLDYYQNIFGKLGLEIPIDGTMLRTAFINGAIDSMEYLLQKGATIDSSDIEFAISGGSLEAVKFLFEKEDVSFGKLNPPGLLERAASHGHKELVRYSLESFTFTGEDIKMAFLGALRMSRQDSLVVLLPYLKKTTITLNELVEKLPFHHELSSAYCLKLLLDHGLEPDEHVNINRYKGTLLLKAVLNFNEIIVEMLLERGANPNFYIPDDIPVFISRDFQNRFRILYSALPRLKMVSLLLKHGAQVTNDDLESARENLQSAEDVEKREKYSQIVQLLESYYNKE